MCVCKGKRYPDTPRCSKDYLDEWYVECTYMCKGACIGNRQDSVTDVCEHEEEKETNRRTQGSVCKTVWRTDVFVCVSECLNYSQTKTTPPSLAVVKL